MKNFIAWFEIPTVDIDRAAKFYSTIFNINIVVNRNAGVPMAFFPIDDPQHGISGSLIQHKDFYKPASEGVLVYLNGGDDLNNVLREVEAAGGKILRPKTQISPTIGYMGLFLDTEGNRIGLMSKN